jgi:hypothetical protein
LSESERRLHDEDRLRRAAVTAASKQPQEAPEGADDDSARAKRTEHRTLWVEHQIRTAMARGEFDDLPGAGKPIPGLDGTHDPDWWIKSLIQRERITVLPPALALRREHAELDARLDKEPTEHAVREVVADFNARVIEARRQLLGGPPVVTPTRDVDKAVAAWLARREQRHEKERRRAEQQAAATTPRRRSLRWPLIRRRSAG